MDTREAILNAEQYADADEIYEALGEYCYWEHTDGTGGVVEHPVCSMERLDEESDDDSIVDSLEPECDAHRVALLDMVAYARSAAEHARDVAGHLTEAIRCCCHDLWSECVDELRRASECERERGDDPATRAVLQALAVIHPGACDDLALEMHDRQDDLRQCVR